MASTPSFVGPPKSALLTLLPGHSTRPRALVTPGSSGSTIRRVGVMSSDGAANKVQFSLAKKRTLASAMGTGALVDGGGGSDTIVRTTGSFLTDGFVAGKRFLLQGCTTLANDFAALLTAVDALTLTFATATIDTAENLAAGAVIYELIEGWYVDVAAGAGLPSVNAVAGLDSTFGPFFATAAEKEIDLDTDTLLVANANSALTTGERIGLFANYGDY